MGRSPVQRRQDILDCNRIVKTIKRAFHRGFAHANDDGDSLAVKAEFVKNPELHFHDMPLTMFADRMKAFFFDEAGA